MDVNRLSQGEKIAAGAAIALFIVMFFSWFGAPDVVEGLAEAAGVDTSFSAWQSFDLIDLILLLTIVVALGVAFLKASASRVNLPVPGNTVTALLGALSTLLVLYRIIDPPSDLDREFGVFLGVVLAALIAYGGWRAMEEEGTSFQDAADRLTDRDRARPAGGAPPPPEPPPPPPGEAPSPGEPPPPPPPPPSGRP